MIIKRRDIFKRNSDDCLCKVSKTNEYITIVKWMAGPNIDKYSSFVNGNFLKEFTFVERKAKEKQPSAGRAFKKRVDGITVNDIFNYFKEKTMSYPSYRERISFLNNYYATYIKVMFDNKLMFIIHRGKQCLDVRCDRKALSPKIFNRRFEIISNTTYRNHKILYKFADLTPFDRETMCGLINDNIYYYQKEDPEKPNEKFY